MSRFPSPDTVYDRIIKNERLTQKTRLAALTAITRPSRTLLIALISDPKTPSRLLKLAAERYETEIQRRELLKRANQRTTP
jgi:hypothetical protein